MTDDQIRNFGYDIFFNHEDHFIAVEPKLGYQADIVIGDHLGIDNRWSYTSILEAQYYLELWEQSKSHEPEGWFRNVIDGRRRENGDPDKETVRF